jgi:hypothetical protein
MLIIGIDPGPEKSAVVVLDGNRIVSADYLDNSTLLCGLYISACCVALEYPEGRGMAVAQSVLDTCYWCGRFDIDGDAARYHPRNIRAHFCGTAKCDRSNVIRAIKDRYGEVGTKKNPGPLYLVGGAHPTEDGASITVHLWDALAVALMYYELNKEAGK